ncbi:SigE family RNA polymerase sigma factor [Nocardioides currus]|uniref:SigE family RNA polymerase sigma factor n=1 Tax=Nocardioides currus TaxID=2133958 RepID=A0A2R7YU62_9ACTN|nr:SigE family RNA polymerase sigma factor [Nocardioides currus]PUA79917.1 SigE family RNA polymerase sigma factor [Nocardioides currus]
MAAPDDAGFAEFVSGSWRQLRQAAVALTGNSADAEDLLQTVLARTYARWPRVARDDAVAYVRRGLVNAYVDTWRRHRVMKVEAVEEVPEVASHDTPGRTDDRAELVDLLARLSPRERTMLVMRHYFDQSEQDVATAMGCSVGTVKSTCSRALQRLRIPVSTTEEL